jgi:Skp family chaperone for outer membrane proteins
MSNGKRFVWLTVGLGLFVWHTQGKTISENIKLSKYQPPPRIAQLAKSTRMTEKGQRLFYLTNPQIEPKGSGLLPCKKPIVEDNSKDKGSDHTNTLGCYIPARGIFILEVNDPRLRGVMETTAAHEMLHAAYHELSASEKDLLNIQLLSAFEQSQDPGLRKLVGIYRQRDPEVVSNELHSLLGTKVANLSPALEKHYQQYFQDRSAVVALSKNYEQAFTQFETKAQQLERQLLSLKASLEQLESRAQEHRAKLDRLDPQKSYEYNQQVNIYNQFVREINQQSQVYNQILRSYKSLSAEEKSLNNALTSGTP